MGNTQTRESSTFSERIVKKLTPKSKRKFESAKDFTPSKLKFTDEQTPQKPTPQRPTTNNNNNTQTPQRPNTNTRTPNRRSVIKRTNSNEWLQIYSPNRTPATVAMKASDFQLNMDSPLGEGSFAKVVSGVHIPTGKKVAVKIIDKTKIPDSLRSYAAREPGILCDLKHANVVKLLLADETATEIRLYLQFMEGSDMHGYIQDKQFLEEDEAQDLFVQMADSVKYCHDNNVCHRDLKLENILISKKPVKNNTRQVLLIDFGFAGHIPSPDYLFQDYPGSVCYAAPELLAGMPYDGTKVDVYALGVTLYVMLHGCYPFYSENQKRLYEMIWQDTPQFAPELSRDCQDLLARMLEKVPARRPSIDEVLAHSWIRDSKNPFVKSLNTRSSLSNNAAVSPIVTKIKSSIARMSPTQTRKKLVF